MLTQIEKLQKYTPRMHPKMRAAYHALVQGDGQLWSQIAPY